MTPTPSHITDRAVARVLAGERASRVAADLGVSVHTVLRALRDAARRFDHEVGERHEAAALAILAREVGP